MKKNGVLATIRLFDDRHGLTHGAEMVLADRLDEERHRLGVVGRAGAVASRRLRHELGRLVALEVPRRRRGDGRRDGRRGVQVVLETGRVAVQAGEAFALVQFLVRNAPVLGGGAAGAETQPRRRRRLFVVERPTPAVGRRRRRLLFRR